MPAPTRPSYIGKPLNEVLNNFRDQISKWDSQLNDDSAIDSIPFQTRMGWASLSDKTKNMTETINNPDLENIWELASKNYSKNERDPNWIHKEDGQVWLAWSIYCATPSEANQYTKAEANKWKTDVIKTSEKLLSLLEKTPHTFNEILEIYKDSYAFAGREVDGSVKLGQCTEDHRYDVTRLINDNRLSDIRCSIRVLLDIIEKTTQKSEFWLDRRSGEEGRRIYFIRALTNAFFKRTGNGKRNNVQKITNSLYDGNISIQQIINLTRDVIENNESFPDDYMLSFAWNARKWVAEH